MQIATILLIEPDAIALAAIYRNLNLEGFEVLAAQTEADGLAILRDINFEADLIIADLFHPTISGSQLVSDLKEESRSAAIPLLVCTGAAQAELIAALKAGAADYICKPFKLDELVLRSRVLIERQPVLHLSRQIQLVPRQIDRRKLNEFGLRPAIKFMEAVFFGAFR